jgi:hypothetical protein
MKKVLVVLLFAVLTCLAIAGPYEWQGAVICGNASGTDDTTFVNAPGYGLPYGAAIAGNLRVWSSSYYSTNRYRQAIMVWDPEFEVLDTVGPEIEWDGVADTIGLCRFMASLGNGNVLYGDWTNDMLTVFDQETYEVAARSEFGPNTGGGCGAFVYDGEQYYITQQILASHVVIWDEDFNVVDTLMGGAGGRNVTSNPDGSIIISPSLGGQYFVEFRGNPDDGYAIDTIQLADLGVVMANLMYADFGPNDYVWLMSRDVMPTAGLYICDPLDGYAIKEFVVPDSSLAPGEVDLGLILEGQSAIWLAQGLIDSSDQFTTLGYTQPWLIRAPCQTAFYYDGPTNTEHMYIVDFYGHTFKYWTREAEAAVEDVAVIGSKGFKLDVAYPNPFNPSTLVPFSLESNGDVAIEVFDVAGRKVQTLVNDYKMAGNYNVTFDGSSLASGNYVIKMTFDNKTEAQKVSLVK